jgi:hypothetical protein
MFLISNN